MDKDNILFKHKNILRAIKEILSKQLGVEHSDIQEEDLFIEDLHMRPTDLADFTESLSDRGFETKDLDFEEISSVEELVDYFSSNEEV